MITLKPWGRVQSAIRPLSQAERESLKESLGLGWFGNPILCLPDGRIIDGHHRHAVALELGIEPRVEIVRVNEAAGYELGLRLNASRRHLAVAEWGALRASRDEAVRALRAAGKTQAETAEILGIPQSRVSESEARSNIHPDNASEPPDRRRKLSAKQTQDVADRLQSGESPGAIAKDLGITATRVRQIGATPREPKAKPAPPAPTKALTPDEAAQRELDLEAYAALEKRVRAVGKWAHDRGLWSASDSTADERSIARIVAAGCGDMDLFPSSLRIARAIIDAALAAAAKIERKGPGRKGAP